MGLTRERENDTIQVVQKDHEEQQDRYHLLPARESRACARRGHRGLGRRSAVVFDFQNFAAAERGLMSDDSR